MNIFYPVNNLWAYCILSVYVVTLKVTNHLSVPKKKEKKNSDLLRQFKHAKITNNFWVINTKCLYTGFLNFSNQRTFKISVIILWKTCRPNFLS